MWEYRNNQCICSKSIMRFVSHSYTSVSISQVVALSYLVIWYKERLGVAGWWAVWVRGGDLCVVPALWRERWAGKDRKGRIFSVESPAGLLMRITRFHRNTCNKLRTNPLKALTQRQDFLCSCCVGQQGSTLVGLHIQTGGLPLLLEAL